MSKKYGDFGLQFIGGDWRVGTSERELTSSDPYTGDDLVTLPMATTDDVDAAYVAAEGSQPGWAELLPSERAEVMRRAVAIFDERHEEIVDWLIRESGSTRVKAEIEWGLARTITEEAATFPGRVRGRILDSDTPGKESHVYREPVGVVAVISPWNFPLHLSQRSVAPALALGNSVVLKPASDTPVTGGLLIAKIFEEAGLPGAVLNVVVGAGSEIGDPFVEHPTPSLVSFTGSTPVGRGIGRIASSGEHLKRVALELGGNNAFVVLADADLDNSVDAAIFGKFLHQGQICMSINRIIVEAPIHDAFLEKFITRAKELTYGDPSAADTAIGPIINSKQLAGLKAKIDLAREEGAHVALDGPTANNVMPPHVLSGVRPEMEIAREEIFGPIVGVLSARDEAHALELANSTDLGLSGAVYTNDIESGLAFAKQINTGMIHVNDQPINDEANAPFGGEKNSGLGRLNGDWAIETFTTDHWITVQHAQREFPF